MKKPQQRMRLMRLDEQRWKRLASILRQGGPSVNRGDMHMEFITVEIGFSSNVISIDNIALGWLTDKHITLSTLGKQGWGFAAVIQQRGPENHPLVLLQRDPNREIAQHNPISKYTQAPA